MQHIEMTSDAKNRSVRTMIQFVASAVVSLPVMEVAAAITGADHTLVYFFALGIMQGIVSWAQNVLEDSDMIGSVGK